MNTCRGKAEQKLDSIVLIERKTLINFNLDNSIHEEYYTPIG